MIALQARSPQRPARSGREWRERAREAPIRPTQLWRRIAAIVLAAAVLAACETTPPAPLMSPLAVTGRFGYTETPIGDRRYRISYLTPQRRVLRSPASVQAAAEALRTMAYDFALWRAAQLALAQNYAGFSAGNMVANINTYADDFYDPYYGPWYGPGAFPGRYPWGPYWPGYWGPSPYAWVNAEVSIDAELLQNPGPGNYDAKDAIEQLRRTYPDAEGLVAGAPVAAVPSQ